MKNPKIIAIIPALNEAKNIEAVLKGVKKRVYKIIVVDDGSKDSTAIISKKYAIVKKHEFCEGYESSLDDGFQEASKLKPDIFITLDADGQLDPEDIVNVTLPIINDEADLVVGLRPYKSRFMEIIFGFYSKIKLNVSDPLSGLKAYNNGVYETVGFFDNINSIGTQLMFEAHKKGFKIKTVNIKVYKEKRPSRFGRGLLGNIKIFKVILKIIWRYGL